MYGPLGGGGGAVFRPGKGQRRMMTKGLRMGSYVRIVYQGKDGSRAEEKAEYEGKIIDKRIGGEDRESYVELEECRRLNASGQIVGTEKKKKFIDAFILECEVVEKTEREMAAAASSVTSVGVPCDGTGVAPGVGTMAIPPMGMPPMMPMMGMPGAAGMAMMPMCGMPMMMMPSMAMPGAGCMVPMGGMMAMPMMGMGSMPTGLAPLMSTGMTAPATDDRHSSTVSDSAVASDSARHRSRSRKRSGRAQ